MSEPQGVDPATRLSEALALAEPEQHALARMLALETDLAMSLIARALSISGEARHAAACEAGAAVARALANLKPESAKDLAISQAVADIIAPRKDRH